jgi:hypothetical protein
MFRSLKISKKVTFALIALLTVALSIPANMASAVTGSDFKWERIIDDSVFFNSGSMSAPQIQAFLEAKVPTCDTNGAQASTHAKPGGGYYTRAQWGAASGASAPYVCLRNYTQSVPTMNADSYCGGSIAGGVKSAATMISDVARACGISPQVILVLLQKEQSLVTDDWPWASQYQSATGYACPDTASCNPAYAGFFNQIYYGARQYKRYAKEPQNFSYQAGRTNYIQYNPNASCGGANVYISNQATAGLYNYTPYVPNTAALANLYGTGDGCSAYGNRNFWRMFNDWFGPTYGNCIYPSKTGNEVYRLIQPNTNGYLLTSDPYEVCTATGNLNYSYDGIQFTSNPSGGDAIYRLEKNGNFLYTASAAERDSAVAHYGYRYNGVAFNSSATPTTAAPYPMYRLSYGPTGGYMYTMSSTERDNATKIGFKYEGVAFYVNNQLGANLYDTFRLSNAQSGYLFTTSDSEKTTAQLAYGFKYEGVGFRTRNGYTVDNIPVYRLAGPHGYLLTSSFSERKSAIALGFRSEGTSFFAYPSDFSGAATPVYRLNHDGTYLYTTSAAERDNAVAKFGYRYEGTAFRLP